MRDRIPTKVLDNGAVRYAVYDEGGAFLRYEYMLAADEPTEEGTALNKANLLDDSTEMALWGSVANRTVNNALMGIGAGLRLHCWRCRSVSHSVIFGDLTWYSLTKATSSSTTTTITYSDNYVVNADNSVSLASPTNTVSISYKNSGGDTYTGVPTLKGKYFKGEAYKANVTSSSTKNPVDTVPGAIYYAPPDAETNPTGTSSKYTVDIQAQAVANETHYGEWEYVYSDNRNAYPDNGEANNNEYEYLGVPFENARMAATKGFKKIAEANVTENTAGFYMEMEKTVSKYSAFIVIGSKLGLTGEDASITFCLVSNLASTEAVGYLGALPCEAYDSTALETHVKKSITNLITRPDGTLLRSSWNVDKDDNVSPSNGTIDADTKFIYVKPGNSWKLYAGAYIEIWGVER